MLLIFLLLLSIAIHPMHGLYTKFQYAAKTGNSRLILRRSLNRILFEREEVQVSEAGSSVATIQKEDNRAQHILKILKLKAGDTIRSGIADVGMSNVAKISSVENGITIDLGPTKDMYNAEVPTIDLILAVPRPQKLEKLLPIVACLGVRNIFLVDASKVEKDYFGSHLLRHPEKMRKLLVEGLCQAEVDCIVPRVTVYRHLRDFLRDEAKDTTDGNFRIIAHPPLQEYNISKAEQTIATPTQDSSTTRRQSVQSVDYLAPVEDQLTAVLQSRGRFVKSPDSLRFSDYASLLREEDTAAATSSSGDYTRVGVAWQARGMLIAVGPEGGWTTEEVRSFQRRGYQLVNLGPRILRTDIAVPVLLGLAHEFLADIKS